MKHSKLLQLVLVSLISTEIAFAEEKIKLPNLVYILTDDQGYGDVSALNPEGKIPTPHMDRIAQEGMTFTDAHSASSVCTPTRYQLLTGRYSWRTRMKKGVLNGRSSPGAPQPNDTPNDWKELHWMKQVESHSGK